MWSQTWQPSTFLCLKRMFVRYASSFQLLIIIVGAITSWLIRGVAPLICTCVDHAANFGSSRSSSTHDYKPQQTLFGHTYYQIIGILGRILVVDAQLGVAGFSHTMCYMPTFPSQMVVSVTRILCGHIN